MPLINYEVSLTLTWSENCVLTGITRQAERVAQRGNPARPAINAPTNATFQITDTKLYVPVVSLSTENDKKTLEQLRTEFKRTIKWNKCRSEMTNQTKNSNLNYLSDPIFTKVKRLFVLSFENENDRTSFSKYYVPNFKIKDFNVLIDGKSFFGLPLQTNIWQWQRQRNIWSNCWDGKKQWLPDRQFTGLGVLFKALQINCNRFKQTNWIRKPWFKTTN